MSFLPHNKYADALNSSEMEENARVIWAKCQALGWSLNAVAAMLGNWESESTLNCNRPQTAWTNYFPEGRTIDGELKFGGFGLPQWTGWNNKIVWYADEKGVGVNRTDTNPCSDIDFQLEYHDFECTYGLKGDSSRKTWYQRSVSQWGGSYLWLPWDSFKISGESPETLATTYYWVYEFSAAYSPGTRPTQALKWYNLLSGQPPIPPTPTPSTLLRKGMKNKWRILHLTHPFLF